MLLVFGLVNATKQLIGEIVGTFLGKFRMQTSFLVADRNPFPVKFRYFHHGLLGRLLWKRAQEEGLPGNQINSSSVTKKGNDSARETENQ